MATAAFALPVARQAILSLQTAMPAAVAAFNADPANTVDLTEPATYHLGGTDMLTAHAFPQVEVAAIEGSTGRWDISRTAVDHDLVVNVVVWQEYGHGLVSPAYESAAGFAKVVLEALSPPNAFGSGVEISNNQGFLWRIDMLPDDPTNHGREFRKWRVPTLCRFALETVERLQ